MSVPAFGLPLDPMRPSEITPPPGLAERPPYCPDCLPSDVLLYPGAQNEAGDILFSCANDGYEAIFRLATGEWTPRPQREVSRWRPPLMSLPGASGKPQERAERPEPVQTTPEALLVPPEPVPLDVEPAPEAVADPPEEPEPLRPPVLLIEDAFDSFERVPPTED